MVIEYGETGRYQREEARRRSEAMVRKRHFLDSMGNRMKQSCQTICCEYDATMSQKMLKSWIEHGTNGAPRIPFKLQLKLLPEAARTTQASLKIVKDEQELQENSQKSD